MSLRWKLSITYFGALLVVIAAVALTIKGTAADAVYSHMGGMMAGMMSGMMSDVELAVETGVSQAIYVGIAVAGLVALVSSVAASAWVTRPLRHMAEVSGAIAAGDYSRRVAYEHADEIGRFSRTFNEMASKLEATEKLRRELLATISHELRTPLTNIQGYMEALLDGVIPNEPETLQLVRLEAQRLGRLVTDIEGLARLEAGAERIEIRASNPDTLLAQAAEAIRPRYEQKGVSLSLVPAGVLPPVWADPDKTMQVLANLLANSLKFTPAGGAVTVEAAAEGGMLRVAVKDTGIGISPEDLPHIFERFYRADKSRSTSGGGAGIGLAVVRSLVEQMGGQVRAESELSQGTTMSFVLPQANQYP